MTHELWQHCAPGRPTVLIGARVPDAPPALETIRVVCSRRRDPLGAWLAAGDAARSRLGLPPRAAGGGRPIAPRGALLGERETGPLGDVIAELNRLFAWRPFHLVIDRLDAIDPGSLAALEQVVARPGWLRPALVLGFADQPDTRFARLLHQVERHQGAVLTALPATPMLVLPEEVPPPARRVLRAAAVIGDAVDVELLAALLDSTPLATLEALQTAADHGVHIDDDGEGHLHLSEELVATLRASTLPSLSRAWHRRLAGLLDPHVEVPETPAAEPVAEAPTPIFVDELPADLADPGWTDTEAEDAVAQHLLAAGETGAAVGRLMKAMDEALAVGAAEQALGLGEQARMLLDRSPPTAQVRRRRVALLTAVARAQYKAVGPRHALDVAHATAEAAARLLRDSDPPELRARLDTLRARILYDQGSPAALEEALNILTECSRWLDDHGAPREAARLFNDQAAIWVRIGDVVRAHHLLEASRAVFARHAQDDPTARLELAETDHLIARLPLHVGARPGRTDDAYALGLERGAAAAAGYAALDMPWEEARVWETLGRLELARGATAEALARLRETAKRQQRLGDALGLASTVEALAETMAADGQHEDAIALLRDSLALNAEKGSARGLEQIAELLSVFMAALPAPVQAGLAPAIADLQTDLEMARARLGG